MTRYGIFSDLHLEFRVGKNSTKIDKLFENIITAECDFLISGGDIHPNPDVFDWFHSQLTMPYISVKGNHDFYGSKIENDFHGDSTIAGGTLWTNFDNNPMKEIEAQQGIYDFKEIRGREGRVMPYEMTEIYNFQRNEIFNHVKPEVVVTHFAPTRLSIAERFQGDPINSYFCNDLYDEIADSNIKLWVHGHTHDRFDYMVGNTRVVCHPLGYPKETYNDVEDYKPLIVEV